MLFTYFFGCYFRKVFFSPIYYLNLVISIEADENEFGREQIMAKKKMPLK